MPLASRDYSSHSSQNISTPFGIPLAYIYKIPFMDRGGKRTKRAPLCYWNHCWYIEEKSVVVSDICRVCRACGCESKTL